MCEEGEHKKEGEHKVRPCGFFSSHAPPSLEAGVFYFPEPT